MKTLVTGGFDFTIDYRLFAQEKFTDIMQYDFINKEDGIVNTYASIQAITFFAMTDYENNKYMKVVLSENDIITLYNKIQDIKKDVKPMHLNETDSLLPF